jgi:4,5-DOPA dioxygenase extradiol
MNSFNELINIITEFSYSEKMPLLFLGHGNPMNAIEKNQFVDGFREIAGTLPRPKAILCISAHWYINATKVTAMDMPSTIHDFYGFPDKLYKVNYPAKGSLELAEETKNILLPNNVELDFNWGLDHGTWSVLTHLYPNADIPVVQLSIDYTMDAQYHFELAKKLNVLRSKGILIIGSGNIIHNLSLVDFENIEKDNYGYDWAIEARETINNLILDSNFKSLVEYKKQSKAIQLAIPTPDHFLPLIYILGLKEENEKITMFNDKLVAGSLSMTSLKVVSLNS